MVEPRSEPRLVLEHRAKFTIPRQLGLQLLQHEETAAPVRLGNYRKKDARHTSAPYFGDQTVVTESRA
jgi:hypothetical protein